MSVYGTGGIYLKLRGFSWKYGIDHFVFPEEKTSHSRLEIKPPGFAKETSLPAYTSITVNWLT